MGCRAQRERPCIQCLCDCIRGAAYLAHPAAAGRGSVGEPSTRLCSCNLICMWYTVASEAASSLSCRHDDSMRGVHILVDCGDGGMELLLQSTVQRLRTPSVKVVPRCMQVVQWE